MANTFNSVDGEDIQIASYLEQLKIEHILQSDRSVWVVMSKSPCLAIDINSGIQDT